MVNVLVTPTHITPVSNNVTGELKTPVNQQTSDTPPHPQQSINDTGANTLPHSDTAVTYERPLAKKESQSEHVVDKDDSEQLIEHQSHKNVDNDSSHQAQYDEIELKQIESLKSLDTEVQLHERAHSAVGGQYAGAPSYSYKTGPDGVKYAVSGEVSIDTAKIPNDPQATLRKAQQIKAAALAPAEPSAQDRRVAAKADRMANQARHDVLLESQVDRGIDKKKSTTADNYNSGIPDHFTEKENLQKQNDFQEMLNNRILQISTLYENSSSLKDTSTFQTQI